MPPENLAYSSELIRDFSTSFSSSLKEPRANTPLRVIKTDYGSTTKPYRKEKSAKQRGINQTEFLTRANAYEVTSAEDQVRSVTIKGKTFESEGKYYETEKGKSFFIIFPSSESHIQLNDQPFILNGASEELQGRQNPVINNQETDLLHEENILFFYKNWDNVLAREFYTDPINPEKPLSKFAEARISDYAVVYSKKPEKKIIECGQIDFLGFGPDNQGIIIEFGNRNREKSIQVQRQTIGLESLLLETNHGLPNPPLTPFIAEYADNDTTRIIRVNPSTRPIPHEIFSSFRG